MKKIVFLAIDNCLFSSISCLLDGFAIANERYLFEKKTRSPLFETRLVTPGGKPIKAHGGMPIFPDMSSAELSTLPECDYLIVPAFLPVDEPFLTGLTQLAPMIREQYSKGAKLGAVCSGVFILAESGLLNGKAATTNWHYARYFMRRYPDVNLKPDRMLVSESGLITAGAATAVFNLGMHIIEKEGGSSLANHWSKSLLVDPTRESQTPYMIFETFKDHGDKEIAKAQMWMEANFAEPFRVDDVANRMGMSPRHFKRRFKAATGETPLVYIQKVRIEEAKKRLEQSDASVGDITWKIGYEDSSTFRRLFRKHVGISPREYRDKFFIG